MTNIETYRELFANAGKGTPEQSAYYCIVKALESSDPQAEIERYIQKARDSIAYHDLQNWPGPRGYRGYFNKQIALYQKVLGELLYLGRKCRVESYGFGQVIDVKPNDPGLLGVWVLVQFGNGQQPSWFISTMNIEFFTEGVGSMAQIDYQDQEMMEPLNLNTLAQALPMEDRAEVSENRLERQAQAHIEAAAQHRDDPLF